MPGLLSRPDDPDLTEAPGQVNRAQELDAVDAAHVGAQCRQLCSLVLQSRGAGG